VRVLLMCCKVRAGPDLPYRWRFYAANWNGWKRIVLRLPYRFGLSLLAWGRRPGSHSLAHTETGRGAAQRQGSAPRPLASTETKGSNQPRTLLIAG